MKLYKTLALIFSLTLTATTVLAQHSVHQHPDHLAKLVREYLGIKEALTRDDLNSAQNHLAAFRKEAVGNPAMKDHEEHARMHASHHRAMVEAIERAAEAESIDTFRTAFSTVTENLVMAIKNQNYDEQNLYLQYCPMALDGEGATWISNSKQIANPYTGNKMPTCGVEKEVLSKQSG